MFILSNFLASAAQVLDVALTIFYWLLLVRCVISWVNADPNNALVQFLYKVTEPVLIPVRKLIPPVWGIGLDLSPLIAFLILLFVKSFLVRTLLDIAARMR